MRRRTRAPQNYRVPRLCNAVQLREWACYLRSRRQLMGANRAPAPHAVRWWNQAIVVAAVVAAAGCDGGGGEGGIPTGDPATGPGGGSNLTCGHASFPSDAALYQDISAAALDPESTKILTSLDAHGWGDQGTRQTLGI